jgi:hypothetical protein
MGGENAIIPYQRTIVLAIGKPNPGYLRWTRAMEDDMNNRILIGLRTTLLIVTLLANLVSTVAPVAASQSPRPSFLDEVETPPQEPNTAPSINHSVDPSRAPLPAQGGGSLPNCTTSLQTALYNTQSSRPTPGAETRPGYISRPVDPNGSQSNLVLYTSDGTQASFDIPPGQPGSAWFLTDSELNTGSANSGNTELLVDRGEGFLEETIREFRSPAQQDNQELNEYTDVRIDPSSNFRASRGDELEVMALIRNDTEDCDGTIEPTQDIFITSASYEVLTENSVRAIGPVNIPIEDLEITATGDPIQIDNQNRGVIPFLPNAPDDSDQYLSAVMFRDTFTVPVTVSEYLELIVTVQFTCEECTNSGMTTDRYVTLVGGPFLRTATTPTVPPRTSLPVYVVGGTTNREAGTDEIGKSVV